MTALVGKLGFCNRPLVGYDDLRQDGLDKPVVADEGHVREMRPRGRSSNVLFGIVPLPNEDVALNMALEEAQRSFVHIDSKGRLASIDMLATMVPPSPRCDGR